MHDPDGVLIRQVFFRPFDGFCSLCVCVLFSSQVTPWHSTITGAVVVGVAVVWVAVVGAEEVGAVVVVAAVVGAAVVGAAVFGTGVVGAVVVGTGVVGATVGDGSGGIPGSGGISGTSTVKSLFSDADESSPTEVGVVGDCGRGCSKYFLVHL